MQPKYQSRELSSALVGELSRWARDQGAEAIYLSVHAKNPAAIRFWKTLGYESIVFKMRHTL